MQISKSTWLQVSDYLESNQSLIVPIGSTEQHGPTALMGTDFMTAKAIAAQVGENLKTYVAPPQNYGMANHHLDFAGSASLNPSTFIQVQLDLLRSWMGQGFKKIIYINGHGGNIAPLNCALSELKRDSVEIKAGIFSWWHLPEVLNYEAEHFGDENGHHATCGEVSVTQYLYPEVFKRIENRNFKVSPSSHHWPLSPKEMKEHHPDGRMDSNPGLASPQHGEKLLKIAVDSITKKIKALGYV